MNEFFNIVLKVSVWLQLVGAAASILLLLIDGVNGGWYIYLIAAISCLVGAAVISVALKVSEYIDAKTWVEEEPEIMYPD